jgi:hypothetical protein
MVGRAISLLSFSEALHTTANYGGFSSARTRMIERMGEYLDTYVDDVLELVRTHEAESADVARASLETAARFNRLLRGDKAAELVRRRAHAALQTETAGSEG